MNNVPQNFDFGKSYKLCNQKTIEDVFQSGVSIKKYPLVAKYKIRNTKNRPSLQFAITAPKRNFRNATDRNKIKRLCREAVRKNKLGLESWLNTQDSQLVIFLIFTGKEEIPLVKLEQKTKALFEAILDDIQSHYA
jgi:ribonuclease P protein component